MTASATDHHDHHGAPTGFVRRWLYSTNHKDIGTMYLIFAIIAAFIGGGISVYMRMELMEPGVQYMADGHVWNVFTTAHGLIMVFFVVMPGLIGGFGNFFFLLFLTAVLVWVGQFIRHFLVKKVRLVCLWIWRFSHCTLRVSPPSLVLLTSSQPS